MAVQAILTGLKQRKSTVRGRPAQASETDLGIVRSYPTVPYERPIVPGAREGRLVGVAPDTARRRIQFILPSDIRSDKASFRSLGGSPASAGLPHFRGLSRLPAPALAAEHLRHRYCDETTRNGPPGCLPPDQRINTGH